MSNHQDVWFEARSLTSGDSILRSGAAQTVKSVSTTDFVTSITFTNDEVIECSSLRMFEILNPRSTGRSRSYVDTSLQSPPPVPASVQSQSGLGWNAGVYSFAQRLNDSRSRVATITAVLGIGGVLLGAVQLVLALITWHVTDTSRYGSLQNSINNFDKMNGTTSINEFHLISLAIGISGVMFIALGIAVGFASRAITD